MIDNLGVTEYLWMERSKSLSKRLATQVARQRALVARACALLVLASVLFGVAIATSLPAKSRDMTVTKRVSWPECVPLLTIYGKRCN